MNTTDTNKPYHLAAELAAISLILYVLSLFLPVFTFTRHESVMGNGILMIGWLGVLALCPAWFANPLYWWAACCALSGKPLRARVASTLAFLLALTTAAFHQMYFDESNATPIDGYGPGLYAWFASLLLMLLAAWLAPLPAQKEREPEVAPQVEN